MNTNSLFLTDYSTFSPSQSNNVFLTQDDLYRIENISFLYEKRIELSKRF